MELLSFGYAGPSVLFFPTRTARFYDYENWRIVDVLKDKIDQGLLQLFCVDSVDAESFYAPAPPAAKIARHLQYERYILQEVLPLIMFRNNFTILTAAGCSLGGYHAVNIAFKYPQFFNKVVAMSARYDLTLSANTFPDLFNGYIDENIYYNMPSMYMPNLTDDSLLEKIRKLSISLIVGKEDPFFDNNKHLSAVLTSKKIPHSLFIWDDEAHRPYHWRKMVRLYL
ncbi:esterase family protein [Niastella vici]|nr:alpha/beta hydrolase-fold protein [Niastella vici]